MREDEAETAETVGGGGGAWLGGCCLKLQPVHEWWVCHALFEVSPHSTRRVRNAMTSLGSVSVYLASVSFIYSCITNQS